MIPTKAELLAQLDAAREALRCYAVNYPCPGQFCTTDEDDTSGCSGYGDDCPTCNAVQDAGE